MGSIVVKEPIVIGYESSSLERYFEDKLIQNGFSLAEPYLMINRDLQEIGIIRKTHNPNKEGHYITYGLSCVSHDGELFDGYGNIKIKDFVDCFSKTNDLPSSSGIERVEHIGLSLENSLFGLHRYKIRKSNSEIEFFTDILDSPEESDIFYGDKCHCPYSDVPKFLIDKVVKLYVETNYSIWEDMIREDF